MMLACGFAPMLTIAYTVPAPTSAIVMGIGGMTLARRLRTPRK